MELTLKNVGIIKDSTIKLDGLTVITGPNNSGKSTVGKALYSLIKTEILPATEYQNEINITKNNSFMKIADELRLDLISRYIKVPVEQIGTLVNLLALVSSFSKIRQIANERNLSNDSSFDLWKSYELLPNFFETFNREYLAGISISKALEERKYQEYLQSFDKRMERAKTEYERTNKFISADDNFQLFLRNSFSRILKSECSMQVISNIFDGTDITGDLILKDEDRIIDSVTFFRNGDVEPKSFEFNKSNFSNVILFDDAYSVDGLNRRSIGIDRYNHNMHLLYCLQHKEDETIFEEEMSKVDINHILDLINASYPGEISKLSGVYTYDDDIIKNLYVQNLATGSKCFATIKQLINNRQISKNSLLILDEPESHLHPEWQNVFAEIIVLLVKEWGVKVLLTTHSPNFMLALDTYSMKNKINGVTHFYQSKHNTDYSVSFDCADENVNDVYAKLSIPFIEMDAMRSSILSDCDEEDED